MITTVSGAIHAGLRCRCPRCGKGELFAGFLTLQSRCEVCGLDYGFADSGDLREKLNLPPEGFAAATP